jgi:hypothetical protein
MIKNKIGVGTLILAMLLVGMALVPAVNAQESSKISDASSELERGLIDTLNSNTKDLSKDVIIANYFEVNKAKISKNNIAKTNTVSGKNNLRTYQLEDGSNITFTNEGFFYISGIKEEANSRTIVTQSTTATASNSYTKTITASKVFYSNTGFRMFSTYAKGYYAYNGNTVKAYYMDSWYTRGTLSSWQITNWEEGGYNYANGALSEIYGRGNFHWGFEYAGTGIVFQDYYIVVKSKCDKYGKYQCVWSHS